MKNLATLTIAKLLSSCLILNQQAYGIPLWQTYTTQDLQGPAEIITPGENPQIEGSLWNPWKPSDYSNLPAGALGSWGVGNGGDGLRFAFSRAKDHAATIVERIKPASLAGSIDDSLRDWILTNKSLLAGDILNSEHYWSDLPQPSCARTFQPEGYEALPVNLPIVFSYPTCMQSKQLVKLGLQEMTQLLIHESVHHFAQGESFADEVAKAITDAWKRGAIDWLPLIAESNSQPTPREKHAATWTGEEMIIHGGFARPATRRNYSSYSDAYAYSPSQAKWRKLAGFEAAEARYQHEIHATKSQELIGWGGYTNSDSYSASWRYDGFYWKDSKLSPIDPPKAWKIDEASNSRANFPRQRSLWTGEKLIVWGGIDADGNPLGGAFDPETNTWDELSRKEALAPRRIEGHSMTWTGEKLIVWGGIDERLSLSSEGAIYDPQAPMGSRWTTLQASDEAPLARAGHSAIWTGDKLIIFSGQVATNNLKGSGGVYDPETKSWKALTTELALERIGHQTVWTGSEMLVFGGRTPRLLNYLGRVVSYQVDSDRWQGVHTRWDPSERENHSAVWTGSSMIVWGGYNREQGNLDDGGIFYP